MAAAGGRAGGAAERGAAGNKSMTQISNPGSYLKMSGPKIGVYM
jgi:hypothetical protein